MHRVAGYTRQLPLVIAEYSVLAFAGAAVGGLSPPMPVLPLGEGPFANAGTALILLVGVGSQRAFGDEVHGSAVLMREVVSGQSRLAYMLAKDAVELVSVVLRPLVFMLSWTAFNLPRGSLWDYLLAGIAGSYAASGVAYMASIALQPVTAQLVCAVTALISGLMANSNTHVLEQVNFVSHMLRALLFAELKAYEGSMLVRRCVSLGAFGGLSMQGGLASELRALVLCGLMARALAMVALVLKTGRPGRASRTGREHTGAASYSS